MRALYSLIPETSRMERAGALKEENLGIGKRREGWSRREWGHSRGWGNRKRERPEAGRESHFFSEKCLSQETGEPLGPMSHRERLLKKIWAEIDS